MFDLIQAVVEKPEPWWQHSLETFIAGTVPVIIWLMNNRRKAKNEMEAKHKENTKRLDQQDEKLEEILNERKYIPPHGHREATGPLHAENIYPTNR